jgi:capsular exopolysaccharide synthesis family protein
MDDRSRNQRITLAQNKQLEATRNVNTRQNTVVNLSQQFGTPENANALLTAKNNDLVGIQSKLAEARLLLEMTNLAAASTQFDPKTLTVEQLAESDEALRELQDERDRRHDELQLLLRTLGSEHKEAKALSFRLEQLDANLQKRADQLRASFAERVAAGMRGTPAQAESIQQLELRIKTLEEMEKKQSQEVRDLAGVASQIARLSLEIKEWQQQADEFAAVLAQLEVERALSGSMQVLTYGDMPVSPDEDKRIPAAVLGTVAGGFLPLALFLLIGLAGQKIRYSDETAPETAGVTLLGILPNLPDLLTDPQQAAIAAHCVHQVRTMLQLTGQGDQRRVYAITSAAPGDGKTSLTLALGLSFAASGCRTLLIDCDLVGGGLTQRLNVATPEGILEALNTRSLLDYVQNLDITDLALLPIGAAHAHHASSFSPQALRRIINEARKHYDIVLIDTGPVLGSIEASPVAAASDGVILAVARGQQRPLVEKALSQLAAIHATVAGIVFNRATGNDVEHSMSRRSIRQAVKGSDGAFVSPTAASGAPGGQAPTARQQDDYGPVAHAVAKSFNPGNGKSQG